MALSAVDSLRACLPCHSPASPTLVAGDTMPRRKKAVSRAHLQQGTMGAWFSKPVSQDEALESDYIPENETDEELEASQKCTIEDVEEADSETEVSIKEAMSKLYEVFHPRSSCIHLANAECVKVWIFNHAGFAQ